MPRFDGTGPQGYGPFSGGGRGFCAGPVSGARPRFFGRRLFTRGPGRGRRNRYFATGVPGWARAGYGYPSYDGWRAPYAGELTPEEEMDMLKDQAEALKQQLEEITSRLSTLEKAQGTG